MKLSQLFLICTLIVLGTACGDKADEMAEATCDCLRPMAELSQEMQGLDMATMTTEDTNDMIERLAKVAEEGEACTKKLEEKYPEYANQTDAEAEAKLRAALKKACPDVAEMLELANPE